jgi:MobA/MobL family protein
MSGFDRDRDVPGGGHPRASGGCYHLSFRSGSRGRGSCARAAHAYITRKDEYGGGDRDEAIYTESGHMPSWAEDNASVYWDSADVYERANGRLYLSADFALPVGLDADDQSALASAFAHDLTDDEQLPYTLAIHSGRDADGHEHNPHAHLMISERQNDGIERDPDEWFRRANSSNPERGGAPKSRTFHGREWMEQARERWADLTNQMLEARGRDERVDHRSYERQGVDREPGEHYGPAGAHIAGRGLDHERLRSAAAWRDAADALRTIDRDIEVLERGREFSSSSGREAGSGAAVAERDEDLSPGR